jgi:hypothetical protein
MLPRDVAYPHRGRDATGAAGCLLPAGQASAVGTNPDRALRWQPAWTRRAAERQAQAALARTGSSRRR